MDQTNTSNSSAETSATADTAATATAAAPVSDVQPVTFGPGLVGEKFKFTFKSRALFGEDGKELLDDKGEKIKVKQPTMEVLLPVPTAEVLASILMQPAQTIDASGNTVVNKVRQLLLDSIGEVVKAAAKSQLDEAIEGFGSDMHARVGIQHLDYDKLTLEYLASIEPKARASAVAISEDEWKEFFADYLLTMQAATGKPADKIRNAIDVYSRPTKVRQKKDLLPIFLDQLAVYTQHTSKLEDTAVCVDFLQRKFKKFQEESDKLVPNAF